MKALSHVRISFALAACWLAERAVPASGWVTPVVRADLLAERAALQGA